MFQRTSDAGPRIDRAHNSIVERLLDYVMRVDQDRLASAGAMRNAVEHRIDVVERIRRVFSARSDVFEGPRVRSLNSRLVGDLLAREVPLQDDIGCNADQRGANEDGCDQSRAEGE
jgi:hypothetical protein